jgi:hypothetical protein
MSDQFLTIVDLAMYVDTHNPKSAVDRSLYPVQLPN